MKTKLSHTLVGALLLLLAGMAAWRVQLAGKARHAEQIVRGALVAASHVSYTGLKVTRLQIGGKEVESKALVACRAPNRRRIHYITPPLAGVTVWQDGGQTYRYEPKGKQLQIYDASPKSHQAAGQEEALVLRNYQPSVEGEEKVADRPAYRIRLAARHSGDAWKRLWVDRQTYLLLGTEDYDGSNRLVRATRFQEVSFDALAPDQFRPTQYMVSLARRTYSDEVQRKSLAQVSRAVGFPIKLPRFVPEGYALAGAYTYPCECGCGRPAAQVRWSNGLNTISMFQCGHPCGPDTACSVTGNPHTTSVHVAVGHESFLFLGETDRDSLERMAQSLKPALAQRS